MKKFKTLSSLITYIKKELPGVVEDFNELMDSCCLGEISEELNEIVKENIELVKLNRTQYLKLVDGNYGVYGFCINQADVQFNVLLDYIATKIDYDTEMNTKYKSIANYIKARVEQC